MRVRSPFQYQRWESDEEHIIWLPPEFNEWEGKRCVYITGLRGTGKTTLLKGLEWEQKLTNDSLKDKLNGNPFKKRYIGVYLSMPDFIAEDFINFPPKINGSNDIQWIEEKARVYSLYIEYQILQLFIEAIQGLRGENILKFLPKQEVEVVKKIISERPEIKIFLPEDTNEICLNDLKLCFKQMHESIRFYANERVSLPKRMFPVLQMGKMLEEIVGIIIDFLYKSESTNDNSENIKIKRWTLKACIDQFESLDSYQQKAINTMVARQETGDVSFAIASLYGKIDINSTYIPQHPLTDADRKHYNLEKIYQSRAKFHELITSVTNLRFQKFTCNQDISIDLKYILGEWDINAILYLVLKNSENKKAMELIKRAKVNIGIDFFDFKRKNLPFHQFEDVSIDEENLDGMLPEKQEFNFEIPPLYQTYLVEKLKLKLPHEESEIYEIKSQKSAEIRKKMAAAMVCLCKEYGIKVPYAGYYMVISMSDQCIRDFLRQMHEIYIAENTLPEKFIKQPVNIKKQIEAIRIASETRYTGISHYTPYYVSEVQNLVNSLGQITSEIQSAYKDPSSLKTIEKGRFVIDLSKMTSKKNKDQLKKILNIAEDSHYIKVYEDESDDKIIKFRLHRLFAPKFGFSYRGAYSDVSMQKNNFENDLLNLCTNKDERERKKIINSIISNVVKTHKMSTLDRWVGD